MSSKLKVKGRSVKSKPPISNKAMQEFRMAAFATKEHLEMAEQQMKMQIKKDVYQQLHEEIIPAIREEIEQDTWNESDDWTTLVNTVTLLTALQDLYGFSTKRMMKIIKTSNEYVGRINAGELDLLDMMDNVEKRHKILFEDRYKDLAHKYAKERVPHENTA